MTEIELRNLSRVDRLFPELNLLCCVRLRLLSAYKYCPDRTKTSTSGRMCPYRCRTVRFGHKSRAKMAEFACSNSEDVLHDAKDRSHQERQEEAKAAQARRDAADQAVESEGRAHLDAWATHFGTLQQLTLRDAQGSLNLLATWVVTLEGENPARGSLQEAQQVASERLATRRSALVAERRAIENEEADLTAERERLEKGVDAVPSIPPFRAAGVRVDRRGAPLWQLVDFHERLDASERAGLEAALEASGLLDACWPPSRRRSGSRHTPV